MRKLMEFVDSNDFEQLFIEGLGWSYADGTTAYTYSGAKEYRLTQVAAYRGLRVWVCTALPSRPEQRHIDLELSKISSERLVIFTDGTTQDWRWPRHTKLGSVNAKLMAHQHKVGKHDPALEDRLESMFIDIDDDPTVTELISRMRVVFDEDSETASQRAATLMGSLYGELENTELSEHDATQLLGRLLFLWFGDDAGMWTENTFENWVAEHTTSENFHVKLNELFKVVDDPRADNTLNGKEWGLQPEFQGFRYINGGLFSEKIEISPLPSSFRTGVLEACEFDWSMISPAIFGSMFQTVKDAKARREMGEHYTTETNILRTLRPLFLNELEDAAERNWNSKSGLTKLLNHIAELRFLEAFNPTWIQNGGTVALAA